MNKIILTSLYLLFCAIIGNAQTNAVDFTANDCAGNSHHLFAELDAGKVIVISFVEPCSACIGPSQNAYTTVQSYASSNPGKVVFYLSDDQANTPCSSLIGWANGNGMPGITIFSDPAVKESDYGKFAMPKVVVLAGTDHKVYYIGDDGIFGSVLQDAINSALSATSVTQVQQQMTSLSVSPNPASDQLYVNYVTDGFSDINIDVCNLNGSILKSVHFGRQLPGSHQCKIAFDNVPPSELYFVRLYTGSKYLLAKFIIKN